MKTSHEGLACIQASEALRLRAYPDSAGIWTIGWGTTRYPDGRPVRKGDECTEAEARAWFMHHIEGDEATILAALPEVPLNQPLFDALVSFVYNVGRAAFNNSTLARHINGGRWIEAQREFDRWVRAGGQVVNGLVNRRNAEQLEFNNGIRAALANDPDILSAFNRFVEETNIA